MVSTTEKVWSGEASTVVLRTLDGEIGLLPGHSPLLAVLGDGPVLVRATDGSEITARVNGGFVTVDSDIVIILGEEVTTA
jgi:F-type H+-transporting ATPase subunit epsilon